MEQTENIEVLNVMNKYVIDLISSGGFIPKYVALAILVTVIILITLFASWTLKKSIHIIGEIFRTKLKIQIADSTIDVIRLPLRFLIFFTGILWILHTVTQYIEFDINETLAFAWDLGFIVTIGWAILRFIKKMEDVLILRGKRKNKQNESTLTAIGRLLRLTIMVFLLLSIMQSLGFSISGVLAFGGIGGLAVSFAARDLLANFFGAFMVFIDKPFQVGDWIRSPDREIEGHVEEIGWRMTRIRTFEQRPLYVPNNIFTSVSIETPSRMLNRRIKETIGIRYQDMDKVDAIVTDIKQMLKDHPEMETDKKTLIVALNQFNSYSLDIMIYTFTKTVVWVEYHELKQRILLEIARIVHKHGADFAFPTKQLYLHNQDNEQVEELDIH